MVFKNIKDLASRRKLVGFSLNFGVIGLNFALASPYVNKGVYYV